MVVSACSGTGRRQFNKSTREARELIQREYAVISGPEEARQAVRNAVYEGADVIKVIVDAEARLLAPDELQMIVSEASDGIKSRGTCRNRASRHACCCAGWGRFD